MTWALDSAVEREFSGNGLTIDASLAVSGDAAANNDYLFIVALSIANTTEDEGYKANSCNLSVAGSGGGDMEEMLRVRMKRGSSGTQEDVVQLFAIRNSDIASQLDIESAITLRCRMNMSANRTMNMHFGFFVVWSDSMPTSGNLVDFMEGGICQKADTESGDIQVIHQDIVGDLGISHRCMAQSATIASCSPATYNVFDSTLQDFAFVNSAQTSVMRLGLGMEANQCLDNDNTGDDTQMTLYAMRFAETVTSTGPFTPYFDGTGDNGSTCQPELSTATLIVKKRRRGRKLYSFIPAA